MPRSGIVIRFTVIMFLITSCVPKHKDNKAIKAVPDKTYTSSLGMKMIKINQGYWISAHEITEEQYSQVMDLKEIGEVPTYNKHKPAWKPKPDSKYPLRFMTVKQAEQFCEQATKLDRDKGLLPVGFSYSLPTDIQWMQCVADASLKDANYHSRKGWASASYPEEVGKRVANRLGLYNMRGNVAEYCITSNLSRARKAGIIVKGASFRECRGDYLRVTNRSYPIYEKSSSDGFRIVLVRTAKAEQNKAIIEKAMKIMKPLPVLKGTTDNKYEEIKNVNSYTSKFKYAAGPLKLTPSTGTKGLYGKAVAVTENIIAVGAPWESIGGVNQVGAIYLYRWNGAKWRPTRIASPELSSLNCFGIKVVADGNFVVVSSASSVHVYEWIGHTSKWVATKLLDTNSIINAMGNSIAIDNGSILVGSNSIFGGFLNVYTKDKATSKWVESKLRASDGGGKNFGKNVAVDANTIAVGSLFTDVGRVKNAGVVYVFKKQRSKWIEVKKLVASDPEDGDRFGMSIAVHDNRIVVGAEKKNGDEGAVYIYTENDDGQWSEVKLTGDKSIYQENYGVCVAAGKDVVVVGVESLSLRHSYAYVYSYNSKTSAWDKTLIAERDTSDATVHDGFGSSFALDCETLVVAAPGYRPKGAVFICNLKALSNKLIVVKAVLRPEGAQPDGSE